MVDRQGDSLPHDAAVHATAAPDSAAPKAPLSERIKRAQQLVRRFSTNDYGVDDFLRDKRAEARRER